MKTLYREFAEEIASRRESEFNAAREKAERLAAGTVYTGPTTFEVLNHWTFTAYPWQTLTTAVGEPVSYSMQVTDPQDHTSTFVVTFFPLTQEWIAFCPSFRKDWGEVVIAAVRMRVEENRRQRMAD